MTVEEFINSGTLELYALGLSSVQENSKVEHLMFSNAAVKMEVESIELALEKFAALHAIRPPYYLKSLILFQIKNDTK